MQEPQANNQFTVIAITAIIVALTVSAIWYWIWKDSKHNITQLTNQTSRTYEDKIETLQQQIQQLQQQQQRQLQQRSAHEQDLLNRYDEAIEARTSLENDLTTANTKLDYLQENLNDLQMGDWERKYLEEKGSNDQIFENMARLEDEIELLKQIQEALDMDYQQKLDAERSVHAEQIAALESELAAYAKTNKKLQKRPQPPQSVVKPEKSVTADSPTDYRSARVISLISSTKSLSSKEKLNVLVKVIPTVPDGITTSELTNLTTGMSSGDILSLIKTAEKHIRKTTDRKSISLLLSKMKNTDAEAAEKLLVN